MVDQSSMMFLSFLPSEPGARQRLGLGFAEASRGRLGLGFAEASRGRLGLGLAEASRGKAAHDTATPAFSQALSLDYGSPPCPA
jgi:hypothetical protein